MSGRATEVSWVVLTMGNRPDQLQSAVDSLLRSDDAAKVLIVNNGGEDPKFTSERVREIRCKENIGAPGGRDLAIRQLQAPFIGFLDDDAEFRSNIGHAISDAFAADPQLGAVALRIVDDDGHTARRHVPRLGGRDPEVSGEVTYFLAGACVFRREAYEAVGGYYTDLFYAHEEVELSWRLIDGGWSIRYLADVEVYHPRTEISRHADGWALTGRNRVWIARRTLPWPIALLHVSAWLVLGLRRAPAGDCRREYARGWLSGWRGHIDRRPIRWATVWQLTRLGRPPIV